ncbi:hypothetical protein Yalta_057 [Yalta virus]|nr:hypothetical protein Yalta_057 [Yalta virus]
MRSYVKKHLRELMWFAFLNQTHIFLSHEFFEILFICHNKKKDTIDENSLKLMLRKTIFDSIEKDEEGEVKWISEHNKKFRILIKNDLFFLQNRSSKINRKWFLITYKQLLKMTYDFNFEEEDIDFFELIMEIDEEYKNMLLMCLNKGLVLEDEVYSILNVNTDNYIEDNAGSLKDEYSSDKSIYGSRKSLYAFSNNDYSSINHINNDNIDNDYDEEWDEPEGVETPIEESEIQKYNNTNVIGEDNSVLPPSRTLDELAAKLKQALSNRVDISLTPQDKDD